ncbi:MAG: hypothetical protein ACI84K_000417 [Pseudohongiellaceae bacterium]|jgi:hypothetical protein
MRIPSNKLLCEINMRILKGLAISIVLIVGLVFVPVYPVSSINHDDPQNVNDEKVDANISNQDLNEILFLVRGGSFLSFYEFMSLRSSNEILNISDSKESISYNTKTRERITHLATGKVVVAIGYICGGLCGSGITIYLDNSEGRWVILGVGSWIS